MKYLSRNDLETIGGRVIAAYKRLPAISGQALERVDIDYLCQELLGLRIDYARLSLNGEKIGLTSSCDIGVEVFPEDPSSTEEQYYMLDSLSKKTPTGLRSSARLRTMVMQSTVFLARRETDLVIIKSIFPALLSVSI